MSLPLGIITSVDFKIKIVQVQRDLQYKPPAFITSWSSVINIKRSTALFLSKRVLRLLLLLLYFIIVSGWKAVIAANTLYTGVNNASADCSVSADEAALTKAK